MEKVPSCASPHRSLKFTSEFWSCWFSANKKKGKIYCLIITYASCVSRGQGLSESLLGPTAYTRVPLHHDQHNQQVSSVHWYILNIMVFTLSRCLFLPVASRYLHFPNEDLGPLAALPATLVVTRMSLRAIGCTSWRPHLQLCHVLPLL